MDEDFEFEFDSEQADGYDVALYVFECESYGMRRSTALRMEVLA